MTAQELADELQRHVLRKGLTFEASAMLRQQVEQIDALKADAERYRWLRHGDNDDAVLRYSAYSTWILRNEELDAAIDAAREKSA